MDSKKDLEIDTTTNQRSIGLDLLRIFASFMVVVQHVSSYGLDGFPVGTMGWRASNFYCAGVRWAVPIFFVISGHLFLNREGKFSVSKVFKKNVPKLVVAYFVWLLFYATVDIDARSMNFTDALLKIIQEALNNGKYHLWFLPTMIGCYLMLPVFHTLAEYKEGRYLKCVCVMFFILGIMRNTLFPFQDNYLAIAVWRIDFCLAGYLGYFLLGAYLGRIDLDKYRIRYMTVFLFLTLAAQVVVCDRLGVRSGLLYGNFHVMTFIEVVLLFLIARKLRRVMIPECGKKIISSLAQATLGVYLIHIYALEHLKQVSIYSFTQWLSIPAISLLVFGISMCVSLILKHIPFLGKWLV